MTLNTIKNITAAGLATAAAIGVTALALTFGMGFGSSGLVADVADPPPTSAPPATTDGNGWGH